MNKYGFRSFTPISDQNSSPFSKHILIYSIIVEPARAGEIRDFKSFMKKKQQKMIKELLKKQKILVNRLSPPKTVHFIIIDQFLY